MCCLQIGDYFVLPIVHEILISLPNGCVGCFGEKPLHPSLRKLVFKTNAQPRGIGLVFLKGPGTVKYLKGKWKSGSPVINSSRCTFSHFIRLDVSQPAWTGIPGFQIPKVHSSGRNQFNNHRIQYQDNLYARIPFWAYHDVPDIIYFYFADLGVCEFHIFKIV